MLQKRRGSGGAQRVCANADHVHAAWSLWARGGQTPTAQQHQFDCITMTTNKQTKQEFISPRSACQSVAAARQWEGQHGLFGENKRGRVISSCGTLLTNSPRSSHGNGRMTMVIRVTMTITIPPEKSVVAGPALKIWWNVFFISLIFLLFYFWWSACHSGHIVPSSSTAFELERTFVYYFSILFRLKWQKMATPVL